MKKTMLKIASVILVAALMLPLLCTAGFAVLDDGTESSVKVETAIYKEIDGSWVKVDSVCGGDIVKARVFVNTDFTSKGADLTLFYDNAFFHDSYTVETHDLVFNPDNPLVEAQSLTGVFSKTGSVSKNSYPLLDLIGSDFYDTHNYFQISIAPEAVPFFKYNSSEWLFEFDLTVLPTAKGTGDIFVSASTLCNSQQTEIRGLNFVKGTVNGAQAAMPRWNAVFGVEPQVTLKSNPVTRLADVKIETKIFKFSADENDWVAADTVTAGETVKVRVYLDTLFPTGRYQFIVYCDKDFFTSSGGTTFPVGQNGSAFNSAAGSDAAETSCNGDLYIGIYTETNSMIDAGLLDQSIAEDTLPVQFAGDFGTGVLSRPLDSNNQTEWFLEFELTVSEDATGTGDAFVLAESFANKDHTNAYGDFHKFAPNAPTGPNGLSWSYGYPDIAVKSNPVYVEGEARSILLNNESITVDKGHSSTLFAAILPNDTENKNVVWETSDASVATVSSSGVVTGIAAGEAIITAKPEHNPNNVSATCAVTVNTPVTSVTVTPETAKLNIGATQPLTAQTLPADTNLGALRWTSSNPAVATVDENGVVSAVSPGTASITAAPAYNPHLVLDSCTVTVVRPATGVSVSFADSSLEVGKTSTLVVTFSPIDASNKKVTWETSNAAVATVDANGVVTGTGVGTAIITVTTDDGSFTDTCSITVVRNATSIVVTPAANSVEVGKTTILSVAFTPADTSNKTILWESLNPTVASVNPDGVVRGLSAGTAVIKGTSVGGATDTCTVTVTPAPVVINVSLSTNEATIKYKKGDLVLTANTSPKSSVTWTSSNPKIASVNQNGVVTAKDMGTAIITATATDGSTAQCKVTVTMTFWQRIVRWFKILFGTWNTAMSFIY